MSNEPHHVQVMSNVQEKTMADDENNPSVQNRTPININEECELSNWSKKFEVTREELMAAVRAVGTSADAVEKYLKFGGK